MDSTDDHPGVGCVICLASCLITIGIAAVCGLYWGVWPAVGFLVLGGPLISIGLTGVGMFFSERYYHKQYKRGL